MNGRQYEIRLQVPEKQTVYVARLADRNRSLYVVSIRETPELTGKALHCWFRNTSYQTLTHDEIQQSVKRADAVNNIKEDVSQAAIIWHKQRKRNA